MENIRPVIFRDKVIEGYFVSDQGNVFVDYKVSRCPFTNRFKKIKSLELIQLKPFHRKGKLTIDLTFPENLFEYQFHSKHNSGNCNVMTSVHSLVMSAFCPINENPPNRLKDVWNQIPKEAKEWIQETVFINHIDHDYTNNKLENLEYVTPRENSRKAKEFYGGNVSNKKNFKKKTKVKEEQISILKFL